MSTDLFLELRDLRSLVGAIEYLANEAKNLTSVEAYEAIRGVLADYRAQHGVAS